MRVFTHFSYAQLALSSLIVLLFFSNFSKAQVANDYSFSYTVGTYTPISGGVVANNGLLIPSRQFDDDEIEDIPLGFTFNYNGSNYTSVSLSANGFLTFSPIVTTYTPISSSSPSKVISAFGTDLISGFYTSGDTHNGSNLITNVQSVAGLSVGQAISFTSNFAIPDGATITAISGSGPYTLTMSANAFSDGANVTLDFNYDSQVPGENPSEIRYRKIGTAPNRTFVVQYTRVARYGYLGDYINFQIRLNENGSIEFAYGDCQWSSATQSNVQVGIKGNSNTDFNNRKGSNWNTPIAGNMNTSAMQVGASNIAPVNGSTYRWAQCALPILTSITGSISVCPGTITTYSTNSVAGATYNWTYSSNWVTNSGAGTNAVNVTVVDTSYLTVTATNTCGTSDPIKIYVNSTCPKPTGVTTISTTNTSADITWNSASCNMQYTVMLKQVGTGVWTSYNAGTSTNFSFTGLTPRKNYQYKVINVCSTLPGSPILYGPVYSFSTPDNVGCDLPQNITISEITGTSAKISWDAQTAYRFRIRIREIGSSSWTLYTVAGNQNSITINNLAIATNFEVQIRTECVQGVFTGFSPKVNFTTLNARISEIDQALSEISIFPNPVTDRLSIVRPLNNDEEYNVYVVNTLGQIVMNLSSLNTSTTSIDMSSFPSGIYYINIKDNTALHSYMIIKQ